MVTIWHYDTSGKEGSEIFSIDLKMDDTLADVKEIVTRIACHWITFQGGKIEIRDEDKTIMEIIKKDDFT